MLPITNIAGETFLLNGIKQVSRSKKVNGEKTITFVVVPTEENEHAFAAVDNQSTIIFGNEKYIIKKIQEKNVGASYIKSVEAVHVFFDDLINAFQYNLHTGSQTFFAALTRVFEPTLETDNPYTFAIEDSFTAKTFENFGRDNSLALFKTVLERYEAEFEVNSNHVSIKRKIGSDTGFQLRWKSNIKAIDKEVDTQNLSTVIKGFGGTPSEAGVYPIQREYRSNVEIFGEKHATAVYDEPTSTNAGMDARLRKELIDEPQLSITVDIATVEGEVKNEGDTGFIIYEPMNIKVSARVVEMAETFEYINRNWRAVKTNVTLSNFKNRLSDHVTRFGQTSKQVDRLFAGLEKLPYNVLPEAIRLAAEAINNSLTEVQYPVGQGIVLQDPNNPNNMVRLTSAGIGLSTDGGVTYRSALTGAGIVTNELVAGIIRTNNIQIVGEKDLFYWNGEGLFAYNSTDLTKFVKLNSDGLYIAKGAATIERPDGYKIINNGMLQYDFALQGGNPSYTDEPEVEKVEKYYRTASTTPRNIDYYVFRHDARYVKLIIGLNTNTTGRTARFYAYGVGGGPEGGEVIGSFFTTETDATVNQATITLDFGTPTGNQVGFYARISSGSSDALAYARIIAAYKEG